MGVDMFRIFLAALLALFPLAASAQGVVQVIGEYNTSPPTIPTGGRGAIQLDASGSVKTSSAGGVASGATDSGNPVKVAGVYNATTPTFTNGQRGDLQIGTRGSLNTTLFDGNGTTAVMTTSTFADALSNSASAQGSLYTYSRLSGFNGTTWDRIRGDTNGVVVQPGLSSTFWSYTSGSSPILSNTTTAVTIKAAAGASVRNYVSSCQVTTTAFGASVPLAVRDGAGGTILWALTVPTGGFLQPANITFPVPLKGTANTLLEVVTTTANTSGTVTFNCQGFTGA